MSTRVKIALVLVLAGKLGIAAALDTPIAESNLPRKVIELLHKEFPAVTVLSMGKRTRNGEVKGYDIEVKRADEKFDIYFAPNGEIVSTGKIVKMKRVPAKVLAAVREKYPDWVVSEPEECIRYPAKERYFNITLTKNKQEIEVEFSEAGEFLNEEDVTN